MSSTSSLTVIATPSPVYTTNPVDDFFGTRRSDSRLSDIPPAYDATEYVAYRMRDREPATLAMYLFKFGFLFPPFWFIGVFILFSPLRAPVPAHTPGAWLPEKTDAERVLILRRMRTVELKWARRCLYASLALIHLIIAVVVGVVLWHALRRT